MAYWDVVFGHQRWSDYITSQDQMRSFNYALQTQTKVLSSASIQIALSHRDYQVALQSGLGALGDSISHNIGNLARNMDNISNSIELGFDKLSNGIDELKADFNIMMGDMIWKLEVQNETLASILRTLQAPLDTQAKELRYRAEDAYQNGWYQEALRDFLESEKKNYQDFAVHRSIGNIHFYHLVDLARSREYYCKAAKYARPRDAHQAAEAEYFAGVVCSVQQNFPNALRHMGEACELNPDFHDAYYMRACFAAMAGDVITTVRSLEAGIRGDGRYHERAKASRAFDSAQPQVVNLLDELMQEIKEAARTARYTIEQLHSDCAGAGLLPNDKVKMDNLFELTEAQYAQASSYSDYFRYTQVPDYLESELRGDLAQKDREIRTLQEQIRYAEERVRYFEDIEQRRRSEQFKTAIGFGLVLTSIWTMVHCSVIEMGAPPPTSGSDVLNLYFFPAFFTATIVSGLVVGLWMVAMNRKKEPGKIEKQRELVNLRDKLKSLNVVVSSRRQ
jgi:tetratricopeptide (TPR) repeat protein